MSSMPAAIMSRTGGPEVLDYRDMPIPDLTDPRQVRVRVHAAGVNPVDTKLRANGTYFPDRMPAILGCDGAGVVDLVGTDVKRFKPGDKVFYCNGGIGREPGNYAGYHVLSEEYVARMPANLDFVQAAAVPLVAITAWESLRDRAHLRPGNRLLIHAAAGGVGHVALQLAKLGDAQVAATVGDTEKARFVRDLGADHIIEYRKEDFAASALRWTGHDGVDITLDTVGGDTFCRSFAATRVYGEIVTLLQTSCDAAVFKVARSRNQTIHYELMLTPQHLSLHQARVHQREILEQVARLIEVGDLWVRVSDVLALSAAAEAHKRIAEGHVLGKIVLRIE